MAIVFGLLAFLLMVVGNLPWLIAFGRGHESRWAIFLVQVFLGWTGIGWIWALIWSATGKREGQKSNPACVYIWLIVFLAIGLLEGAILSAFMPKLEDFAHTSPSATNTTDPQIFDAASMRYIPNPNYVAPVPDNAAQAIEQTQDQTETDVTAHVPAPVKKGPQFYPTSFGCNGTLSKDEYLICTDDRLAVLDQNLFDRYQSALKMANDSNQVIISQHMEESLRVRKDNCANRSCIVQWFADEKAWYQSAVHQMQGV